MKIINPNTAAEVADVRHLMLEYALSMGLDLAYQQYDKELADLPGRYASPTGWLLLAKCGGAAAGCVALRDIGDNICEMKRMYVPAEFRRRGIGRLLAEAIIKKGAELGYSAMRLDTRASFVEAIALYRSLGFQEINAYEYNPSPDAMYMELSLQDTSS